MLQQSVEFRPEPVVQNKRKVLIDAAPHDVVLVQKGVLVGCLELFSGSGKLTKTFRDRAIQCTAVDNLRNKAAALVPCLRLNLTVAEDQLKIFQMLESGKIRFVWLAPPCGTASRARERKLPSNLFGPSGKVPVPLRSDAEPLGLSTLQGQDLIRVEAANVLYSFTMKVVEICRRLKIYYCIENPWNSLFWKIPFVEATAQFEEPHDKSVAICDTDTDIDIRYQACMHGGLRDKNQRLRTNLKQLSALYALCDGLHTHAPWGYQMEAGFATSGESEYAQLLCDRIVDFTIQGIPELERSADHIKRVRGPVKEISEAVKQRAARQTQTGKQPRGKLSPVILDDYLKIEVFRESDVSIVQEYLKLVPKKWMKAAVTIGDKQWPAGSRVIDCTIDGGGSGCSKECLQKWKIRVGLTRTVQQWLEEAFKLEHPMRGEGALGKEQTDAIDRILARSKQQTRDFRIARMKHYLSLARGLSQKEEELHQAMQPEIRSVMKGKRILLMAEMMKDAGLGEEMAKQLTDLHLTGFPITGNIKASGLFSPEFKEAGMTLKEVWEQARELQSRALNTCRSSGDKKVDEEVWAATLQECAEAKAAGPLTVAQVELKYGTRWIPNRRFGLVQGAAVRPIDDYSEFCVNSTVSSEEKLTLGGLDEAILLAQEFSKRSRSWDRRIHPDWRARPPKLQGKCADLTKAYKQLARRTMDGHAAITVVWNPNTGKPALFESWSLAFGAVGSVLGFNFAARVLSILLNQLFDVVSSNFFDDYPIVEDEELADNTSWTEQAFWKLVGWQRSENPKKCKPFASVFRVLGVELDLSEAHQGRITVSNTEERKAELTETLELILKRRELASVEAHSVAGRFGYCYSHFLGRALVAPLATLRARAHQKGSDRKLSPRLAEALSELKFALNDTPPRSIDFWSTERPTIVFTDGAVENNGELVTMGAVIFSPRCAGPQYFGSKVPQELVSSWNGMGSFHVIAQTELLPIICVRLTWPELLRHAWVIYFIDNQAVKASLVNGSSKCFASFELVALAARLDMLSLAKSWYARVPSPSNYADGTSRLDFSEMEMIAGSSRINPVLPNL